MADFAVPLMIAAGAPGNGVVEGLAAIGQATGVARSAIVYVAVSAGHVLGIALLVGPILLADLAILGVIRTLEPAAVATLRWTARIGVGLAVFTGVLLLSSNAADYLINPVFWGKMGVLVLALANAAVFEWRSARGLSPVWRLQAAASMALWLTVLVLGRWIPFV